MKPFVSRAGQKLEHALAAFGIDVAGRIAADLGSNTGGFVDCLLRRGAAKVYAIDTGYGVLDWNLRKDPRAVVMERCNAMHVELPETVSLVTIDVAWTRQRNILPAAAKMIVGPTGHATAPPGEVVSLIKPHYEADASLLRNGVLPEEALDGILKQVHGDIAAAGFMLIQETLSPIRGAKGNAEVLVHLRRAT